MVIGWSKLYEYLQENWDALGPLNYNRNKLSMIVEIKFASLLMCDLLKKKPARNKVFG